MVEEREVRVKLVREEEKPFLCGLTYSDLRRVDHIHDMVDTLHSMCEERVGSAEQVKPAVSFRVKEACQLRDFVIEKANKLLTELLDKARRQCP